MNNKMLQQGDVIIRELSHNFLEGKSYKKIKSDKRGIILAEGETHGHFHGIECEETDAELIQIGEQMILKVEKEVTLKHQEHKPFTISPGIYEIGQVVEKDWLSGMVNKVVD